MDRCKLHPPRWGGRLSARAGALLAFIALGFGVLPAQADPVPDMVGYTRPGKDAVVADKDEKEAGVGVTIYYAVYDRVSGSIEDPWQTGLKTISKAFVPGKGSANVAPAALDTSARYLYVYQVVNDSKRRSQIKLATVRLLVDPEYITSWGHFAIPRADAEQPTRGVGFTSTFTNPNAVAVEDRNVVKAVSTADPNVSDPAYRPIAPAFLAPRGQGLGFIPVDNLKRAALKATDDPGVEPEFVHLLASYSFETILAGEGFGPLGRGARIAQVDWANPVIPTVRNDSTLFGLYSQLGTRTVRYDPASTARSITRLTPLLRRGQAENVYPAVQAVWADTPLAPGQRSVVFGFTSNVPPTYDGIRLRANSRPANAPVAGGPPDLRPANLVSDGTVPTPAAALAEEEVVGAVRPVSTGTSGFGIASLAPAEGSFGGGGSSGGGTTGGGGTSGGGGSRGGGFGGLGGGMGGGLATGTTGTGTRTTTPTDTNTTQDQAGRQVQNQSVVVNVSQRQQQQQQQQQFQVNKNNGNKCCCCDNNNVIPEPAALLTTALAMPVVVFFARRRKPESEPETVTP